MSSNGNAGYIEAFSAFKYVGVKNKSEASKDLENKWKNRYPDILAYDHSRVYLTEQIHVDPTALGNDYINANWIPGSDGNTYIAAQCPVLRVVTRRDTFSDFWMMVFDKNVDTIVMLTGLEELKDGTLTVKCNQYWPDKEKKYGDMTVTLTSTTEEETYIVRTFTVKKLGGVTHDVKQFAYTKWPDHGVPESAKDLLEFREVVDNEREKKQPLLVHCSAGVGRTGTYIAIDYLINQLLDKNFTVNSVDDFIKLMREARNLMVQTQAQYIFIWKAILRYITVVPHWLNWVDIEDVDNANKEIKKELNNNPYAGKFYLRWSRLWEDGTRDQVLEYVIEKNDGDLKIAKNMVYTHNDGVSLGESTTRFNDITALIAHYMEYPTPPTGVDPGVVLQSSPPEV
jgi:protein tyrosine phosphatase